MLAPLLMLLLTSEPATEALAAGERGYAARAGANGACDAAGVDAAIAEYRRAIVLDPAAYAPRLGFLRVVFFRGGFCAIERGRRLALFAEAKKVAQETVEQLEADGERAAPRRAEVYLWAAVSWGQWSIDHKLAAAWQGAAGRIRGLAQAVIDIRPETLDGGAFLILGRLHTEAPRIRFLTGWVSRPAGIEYLRRGLAIAPGAHNHVYFLGRALLDEGPAAREEARALLARCARLPPRAGSVVEDQHYAALARALAQRVDAGLYARRDP
jgi:hypothetical protein